MRLKKLFMLIVAMVMSIPTMFAQDPLYVVYNNATGNFTSTTASLTEGGALTYDASSQTYKGEVTFDFSGLTGVQKKAFAFYTGSTSNRTWYGSGMAGMATNLNMQTGADLEVAMRNQSYGWYMTQTNAPFGMQSPITLKVSVNLATMKVTFSIKEMPEFNTLYLWSSSALSGTLTYTGVELNKNAEGLYVSNKAFTTSEETYILFSISKDAAPNSNNYQGIGSKTSGESAVSFPAETYSKEANIAIKGVTRFDLKTPNDYSFAIDLTNLKITFSIPDPNAQPDPDDPNNPDNPSGKVLYLAQPLANLGTSITSANAQWIPETSTPGIYQGVLHLNRGMSYIGFFTDENGVVTKYGKGGFASVAFGTGTVWPGDDPEKQEDAVLQKNPTSNMSFYIPSYPTGCEGDFTVTVNLNDLTLSIEAVIAEAKAPTALYLWGTTGGYEASAHYTNMGTLVKSTTDNTYTLTMDVPACGIFEPDGEYTPGENDPKDRGFYFFLSDNGSSFTASGAITYQAPIDNKIITASPYSATLVNNKTGGNFIATVPGNMTFTFNFDNMNFTSKMNQEFQQVQLNFTGETKAYTLVTVYDLTGDEGAELSKRPQLLVSYNGGTGLTLTPAEGYQVEVTCTTNVAQGQNTYVISETDVEGQSGVMLGLYPGANGLTFNVNVTEAVKLNEVTFKFTGVENAVNYVNAVDWATTTPVENLTNPYVLWYENIGGLILSPKEGYALSVKCATSSLVENKDYAIQGVGTEDSSQVTVGVYPTANEGVFEVTVTELPKEPVQPKMFVNVSNLSYGNVVPNSADKELVYNEETGSYEITLEEFAMKNEDNKFNYLRFYLVDEDGERTPWNVSSSTAIPFNLTDTKLQYQITEGKSSPIRFTSFANDLTAADVKLTLTLNTGSDEGTPTGLLVAEQLVKAGSYPAAIYLWGSTQGGRNTTVRTTLEPTSDAPYIYTATYDMPISNFDPADAVGGEIAFAFFLSTSNESMTKGTRFLAHKNADENASSDADNYVISLKTGETYKGILQSSTLDGSSLLCYTPGNVEMSFNIETLEFTVKMVDALKSSTLTFDGNPNEAFEKYLSVTVNGEPYAIEVNPQTIWYSGDLDMTLAPQKGWKIAVEGSASADIQEENGVYTVKSSTPGLNYNVTIENANVVTFTFMVNDTEATVETVNSSLWCIDFMGINADEDMGLDDKGNLKDEFILSIENNPYVFNLNSDPEDQRGSMIMFVPAEGYDLEISCTNWEPEAEGDEAPFAIDRPTPAAEMGELDGGSLSTGWVVILSAGDAAAGLNFNVNIKEALTDGIRNIYSFDAEDGLTVVNMQGVVLLRNGNAADLDKLEKGMYIVNGKKIVVRK